MSFVIIIPAHNEAGVIAGTIASLLDGLPEDAHLIVACNGCTDGTAERARVAAEGGGGGERITILDIETPSKIAALNAGDACADRLAEQRGFAGFPRFYIDADIRLTGSAVAEMARRMNESGVPAAAPRAEYRLERSSLPVRQYYRLWLQLPYVSAGMVGCGVYALSEAGRRRFGAFPNVIADDGYVRSLFAGDERACFEDCPCQVSPPRTLRDLIKIKTRSRLGQFEIDQHYPGQRVATDRRQWGGVAGWLFQRPELWSCVPAYLWVNLRSRQRAKGQLRLRQEASSAGGGNGPAYMWERDESSRLP